MKQNSDGSKKRPDSKFGAGAAGAGGGTLLVLLARNLPDSHPWKSWLIIIAPSTTVFLSGVWLWLRALVTTRAGRLETERLIEQAKATLERGINNPLTSPEHRQTLRKKYEELELLQVEGFSRRLQVLTTDTQEIQAT